MVKKYPCLQLTVGKNGQKRPITRLGVTFRIKCLGVKFIHDYSDNINSGQAEIEIGRLFISGARELPRKNSTGRYIQYRLTEKFRKYPTWNWYKVC